MKKLAVAAVLALAAPAFACPNANHDQAPQTADKDKDTKATDTSKAKPTEAPKATDTAKSKDAKDAKKPDKVSAR